jgi:hypothetical protein
MTKYCFLLAFLLGTSGLFAQKDTTFITQSEDQGTLTPGMITPVNSQLYRLQQPVKFMAKWDIASLLPNLSAELKLSKAFSVEGGFEYGTRLNGEFQKTFSVHLEPRWYPGLPKRIKSGQQANNLSGNYLGAEFRYQRYQPFDNTQNSVMLYYGVQHRLFDFGYFDIGFGAGLAQLNATPYRRGGQMFLTRTRARIGLAKLLPKAKKQDQPFCEVLKCFREERRMWKIDLYDFVELYAYSNFRALYLNPSIAFEQKIARSAFSVQTEFSSRFSFGRYQFGYVGGNQQSYNINSQSVGLDIQPRWYFTLKNRIAKGRSGNNLSGMYVGVNGGGRLIREASNAVNNQKLVYTTRQLSAAPVLGIQYRFLKHGYIDLSLGAGVANENITFTDENGNTIPSNRSSDSILHLIGGLKVGFAF